MNRTREHTELLRRIEVELSKLPGVVTTQNPSGLAAYGNARVPYGAFRPGAPDMLVLVGGKLIAIEGKTGSGRSSEEQIACAGRIEYGGGVYRVVRDVDAALWAVEGLL